MFLERYGFKNSFRDGKNLEIKPNECILTNRYRGQRQRALFERDEPERVRRPLGAARGHLRVRPLAPGARGAAVRPHARGQRPVPPARPPAPTRPARVHGDDWK